MFTCSEHEHVKRLACTDTQQIITQQQIKSSFIVTYKIMHSTTYSEILWCLTPEQMKQMDK